MKTVTELFLFTISRSQSILIFILAVLAVRILFRQMPKRYLCLLWFLVFARLLMPPGLCSFPFSLNPFPEENLYNTILSTREQERKQQNNPTTVLSQQNPIQTLDFNHSKEKNLYTSQENGLITTTFLEDMIHFLSIIWISIAFLFILYSLFRMAALKRKLCTATKIDWYQIPKIPNTKIQTYLSKKTLPIYESDQIKSPFLFGIIQPVIYLPLHFYEKPNPDMDINIDNSSDHSIDFVIFHEMFHILRRDYLTKPLLFFITCIYWYHPLVWLSFFLFSKDMEMAVDDAVCQCIEKKMQTDYAKTLFQLSIKQSNLPLPLSFGESHTKERIQHILSWQKGGKWLTVAAIAVIIVIFLCFGSNSNQPVSTPTTFPMEHNTPPEVNLVETSSTENYSTEEPFLTEEFFTMETLIQLCQDDNLSQLVQQQGITAFSTYKNIELVQLKQSLTWVYTCILPYQTREYELQIYYWLPETASQYGHTEYEVDGIHIIETKTGDRQLLYSSEPKYTTNTDILSFLEKQYNMEQYMTLTFPENYIFGDYKSDTGMFLECQIFINQTENYKEPPHGSAPEIWYVPGGIGILNTTDILHFENNQLSDVSMLMNHSCPISDPEVIDGCEVSALLIDYSFDLFTLPEWEEYKTAYGETTASLTSEFWYVFLGKEESQNGYVVFLNKTYFTKEDAIRLAQSIHFTEKAF